MPDFFLGRQPIFDQQLRVMGYELLYRNSDAGAAGVLDGDQATSQVILNSVMEMGLTRLVGNHQAFINLTRNFILNHDLLPPTDGRMVLEILEDVDVDDALLDAVQNLRGRGYVVALDDFVYHPHLQPLVELADIIKIDLMALGREELQRHVDVLKNDRVKLLAEKIETKEELEHCRTLGFDYFQGYFLCRPSNLQGKRLPANRLNTLALLSKLQDPETSLDELEQVIVQDVTISYKLLKYINSAVFFGRRELKSIHQAIIYLGRNAIKGWATLIALSGMDDNPRALIVTALVRAKMCERLAAATGDPDRDSAFTVGMFSALDALMDMPLPELVEALPLAEDVSRALLAREGKLGHLLNSVLHYERGEWEAIDCQHLEHEDLTEIYLHATEWADQTVSTLA